MSLVFLELQSLRNLRLRDLQRTPGAVVGSQQSPLRVGLRVRNQPETVRIGLGFDELGLGLLAG